MASTIAVKRGRNVGLDLLRISLALLIFMFHSNMHFDCHYGMFEHVARMGAVAMTGFFMLSGYVLNLSNQNILIDISSYKKFLYKRFASIVPLYWFVALMCIVLDSTLTWKEQILLFPIEFLGLQTVFSSLFPISHNGGTWFVSCIIFCYLLFPFIQWIVRQLSNTERKLLGGVIFTLLFVSPFIQRHFHLASLYDNPFFRILEFCIGVLLSSFVEKAKETNRNEILQWGTLIFLIVCLNIGLTYGDKIRGTEPRDYMLMNWVALPCFAGIIVLLGKLRIQFLEHSTILKYGSGLAYSFFLAQFFIWGISYHIIVTKLGLDSNVIRIVFSFVFCLFVSVCLHECVEKPAKKVLMCYYGKI